MNVDLKVCYRCKEAKPRTREYFSFNRAKLDGFNSCCLPCHRASNATQRQSALRRKREAGKWKRDEMKIRARVSALKEFGTGFKCAILNCQTIADDLHHVDYSLPLDVVPLCRMHHGMVHRKPIEAD